MRPDQRQRIDDFKNSKLRQHIKPTLQNQQAIKNSAPNFSEARECSSGCMSSAKANNSNLQVSAQDSGITTILLLYSEECGPKQMI